MPKPDKKPRTTKPARKKSDTKYLPPEERMLAEVLSIATALIDLVSEEGPADDRPRLIADAMSARGVLLAEKVDELDQWLRRGNPLPVRWKRAG